MIEKNKRVTNVLFLMLIASTLLALLATPAAAAQMDENTSEAAKKIQDKGETIRNLLIAGVASAVGGVILAGGAILYFASKSPQRKQDGKHYMFGGVVLLTLGLWYGVLTDVISAL